MRVKRKTLEQFLTDFDTYLSTINEHISILLIGGTALLYYRQRRATKDIDMVLNAHDTKVSHFFLDDYSKKNDIEIQYGLAGRFQSMLLNEDMMERAERMRKVKIGFFSSHHFRYLDVRIICPIDLVLLKIEAASYRGGQDRKDVIGLIRRYKISMDDLTSLYKRYKPEIELVPRMIETFNALVGEALRQNEFDVRQYLDK